MARIALALAGMMVCLLAASAFHVMVGSLGRDPRPAGFLMALLLAGMAFHLTSRRGYRIRELVVALLAAELLYALVIGWFADGGLPRLGGFFASWFLSGNLFLAVPWLVGMVLGGYARRRREHSHC